MAWLYQPKDRRALGDVAKLAVTLRQGKVPVEFLDDGFEEVQLGNVGRVLLMAPTEIGLPPSERKFALARGTSRLCLAEIVAGVAGDNEARAHLDAMAAMARMKGEGGGPVKQVIGWLIAEHIDDAGRALLHAGGAVGTSTSA